MCNEEQSSPPKSAEVSDVVCDREQLERVGGIKGWSFKLSTFFFFIKAASDYRSLDNTTFIYQA